MAVKERISWTDIAPMLKEGHKELSQSDVIEVTDLINFTARAVQNEEESFRDVQKRVRERVRNHQKRGHLTPGDALKAGEYFTWAAELSRYPALQLVEGLPLTIEVKVSGLQSNVQGPHAHGFVPPKTKQALLEFAQELYNENQELKELVQSRQSALDECEQALGVMRDKQKKVRHKLSEAGKKGGRGNAQ